jgi:hypothetical protein
VAFLKRVFSADYRRGLAAEAAGEWLEAARAYGLAGERAKVAEMHLLAAERAPERLGSVTGADGRLAQLRTAIRWADGEEPEAREVRRRIARALLAHVRGGGLVTPADRALLLEAAALFTTVEDHAGAGECYELAGDEQAAADAYGRAGEVERLEAVLAREEARRHVTARRRQLAEDVALHLAAGERDRALGALRQMAAIDKSGQPGQPGPAGAPGSGGAAMQQIAKLERRLIVDGRLRLRVGDAGAPLTLVGRFPFTIGREASCDVPLREGNVSRLHAEVLAEDDRFLVRDRNSKNGLTLNGVVVDGELPLDGEGELGLGTRCGIAFRAGDGLLRLQVVRGVDRGLEVLASRAPIPLGAGAAELRFLDGRPFLLPAAGFALRLGGARAGARVQLIHEDEVDLEGEGRAVRVAVE